MRTFFTFDYELFMGNVCGSIQNCLVTPIKQLLPVFDKYDVKATFFVDAALLYKIDKLRHEYKALEHEWKLLVDNIRLIHESGHDIELHIHPQWYYSDYNGISWIMDLDHFKLSDMKRENVNVLVRQSKELLESLISKNTVAFRAGGYSIQDLQDYPSFFRDFNILVDSTVLSGLKFKSENQSYDYTVMPDKSFYRFSRDITKEDVDGPVLELPITTKYISKAGYFLHQLYKKKNSSLLHRSGDGRAIIPAHYNIFTRIKRVLDRDNFVQASFDDAGGRWMSDIFDDHLSKDRDLVIISHPKLLTEMSFIKLNEFLAHSVGKTEFCTMEHLVK